MGALLVVILLLVIAYLVWGDKLEGSTGAVRTAAPEAAPASTAPAGTAPVSQTAPTSPVAPATPVATTPTSATSAAAPAAAPATADSELVSFVGGNPWEKRLPSGARNVFQFIFKGANMLMSRTGYTASGTVAGDPSGATTTWAQTGPSTLQITQGTTKIDLKKTGARELTMGVSGEAGTVLTAA